MRGSFTKQNVTQKFGRDKYRESQLKAYLEQKTLEPQTATNTEVNMVMSSWRLNVH